MSREGYTDGHGWVDGPKPVIIQSLNELVWLKEVVEELGRPMNVSVEAFEAAKKVHDEALPYLTMHARLAAALEAAAPIIRADAGAKALEDAADDILKDQPVLVASWLRARAVAVRGEDAHD